MKIRHIAFSLFLLFAFMGCQKDDLTFDESYAKILRVVETGVSRNTDDDAEKFPYRIRYDLDASLSDIAEAEEWGVYFVDLEDNPIEFSFGNVSTKETKHLYLNTTADALHVGKSMSYIEVTRGMGLYVKRKGRKGDLQTYYGNLSTYKLRYDFPSTPSVEYSNPQIASHEAIKVESDTDNPTATVRRYKTVYTYDLTVKGAFWIDYLEDALSSGWKWDEDSHYSLTDGTHTKSVTMTYKSGTIEFSQWTVIHCLDTDDTVESKNWLNVGGSSYIERITVSDYDRAI